MTTGLLQGEYAALMAIKILEGVNIEIIENVLKSQGKYIFDFLQYNKFNIKKKQLPKDSVILNYPYSIIDFYEANKNYLLLFLL